MKQTTWMKIAGLSLAAMSLSAAPNLISKADIPFPFQIGDRQMESGRYSIEKASSATFLVRHTSTGRAALLQAPVTERTRDHEPSLKFRCYAEGCVLSELTHPETSTRFLSIPSRRAKGPFTVAVVQAGTR